MAKKALAMKHVEPGAAPRRALGVVPKKRETAPALGPGLHAATLEIASGDGYRARTLTGERLLVLLGEHVEPGLVEECLKTGRMIVLADSQRGPTIVGALQTTRALSYGLDGRLSVEAKEIRLAAERGFVIESGPTTIRVDKAGVLRLEGDKMVIDMGSLVRFLSAHVALP